MSEIDFERDRATSVALHDATATLDQLASVYFSGPLTLAPSGASQPDLEARYRTLIEQIPAIVFMAPLDEGIGQAYVSPQIESIMGFTQEEWLADPVLWYRHIHPEDRQRWSLEASQLVLSGEPFRSAYRVISRNGATVWIHCEAKMVRRPDGRPWFIHGVGFNITGLKDAEAALRAAHDELEKRVQERTRELTQANAELHHQAQLMVQAPDPVIAVDNNGIVTSWNAAAARVIGWTEQEAVGKSLETVLPSAPGSISEERIRADLTRAGRFEGELTCLTRSGSSIVVEATITRLRGSTGESIGFVGGLRDITERRQAEQALRRSEQRLLLITETVPIGILLFDSTGAAVFANSFAASLLEMSKNEAIHSLSDDRNWRFADQEGKPISAADGPIRHVLATSRPVSDFQAALLTAPGKRLNVSISAAPILDADGRLEGVVMAMEDITARRELEEKYQHSQKMESLGRLAGGVAHDFNNLLTVINGYSSLLLGKPGIDNQTRLPLEAIQKAGAAAADLCQQLLAFSRRRVDPPSPLSLSVTVREAEKLLKRLLKEEIELVVSLDPTVGPVLANAGPIQQVLMNLVLNSRDAMPHGGRITITTSKVDSSLGDPSRDGAQRGSYARLTVEDTGVGMSEETRQHIFEPFFTTKESGKGTGLGLATVYGIVKQYGGWIHVDSEPGKGARFSAYLPLTEETEAEPVEANPFEGGSETVLVVEDQSPVREFFVDCLRSYGYTVLSVESGVAALDLMRGGAVVDLVVTDMVMPGMSGKQLVESLNLERPGLLVVMVSGYSAEQIEPLGLPASQLAILSKPVAPDRLAGAVQNLLDTSKARLRPPRQWKP